jgi:proteasome lid subunit RPN8/RPN11
MVALTDPIHIKPEHWEQMLDHVSRMDPEEACGLAAGKDRLTMRIYTVENALHSTVHFRMEPQEQVDAILEMEELGWEMLAIFHSHPTGPPTPSQTDVAEAAFPEAVNLIWSKSDDSWVCRGFLIKSGEVKEISIQRFNL